MQTDPTQGMIIRLMRKHSLDRIEMTSTAANTYARAIPNTFHPQVALRREAAYLAANSKAGRSISLEEASEINRRTLESIASGSGLSPLAALISLEKALGDAR